MKQGDFRDEVGVILGPLSVRNPSLRDLSSLCATLERFAELILGSTARRSLVSRSQRTVPAVWSHILDSLHAVPLIDPARETSLADVGSGNGLPGIPIAVAFPTLAVHLIDRSAGKVEFLEYACASLGLRNVIVHTAELGSGIIARVKPCISTIRATTGPGSVGGALAAFSRVKDQSVLVFITPTTEQEWIECARAIGFALTARNDYELPGKLERRSIIKLSPD